MITGGTPEGVTTPLTRALRVEGLVRARGEQVVPEVLKLPAATSCLARRSLSASANVETLKLKLLQGVPVRTAANNIMNTVMRRGQATGCEVIISGKIRGQRAKAQKYTAGYQISTGQPKNDFIDIAIRHVQLRQGILGLKVKVMQGTEIQVGNKKLVMPDQVKILEPKDEDPNIQPQCHEMRQHHDQEQA